MKLIKKLLNLPANATEKKVEEVLTKLIHDNNKLNSDYSKLKKEKDELAVQLEAQTEVAVKGSARINELGAQLKETNEMARVQTIECNELFDANKALTLKVEQLKADGNEKENPVSKEDALDLKKAAKAFLKENKEFKEVFLTDDGQVFIKHSFANTHTKQCGGKVHTFKR